MLALLFVSVTSTASCTHFDRANWQKPELVISKLDIHEGDRIADFGAGGGYFTFRLANATGQTGRVYAVDIDSGSLAEITRRAEEEGFQQVESLLVSATAPQLPEPLDLIFLCNTYHHLEKRTAFFRHFKEYLRPDGRIAVIDLDGVPWYWMLSAHQTEAATIRAEMEAAGYRLVAEYDDLPYQNFLVFAAAESPPQ